MGRQWAVALPILALLTKPPCRLHNALGCTSLTWIQPYSWFHLSVEQNLMVVWPGTKGVARGPTPKGPTPKGSKLVGSSLYGGGLPVGGSLWGAPCGGLSVGASLWGPLWAPHQAKAQAKAANLFTDQHEAGGHTHSARPLPSAMAISSWTRNLCPLGKAKLASSSAS